MKVGQKVEVTADAFEDQTFEGTVTKVSMEGTAANGVTYYPVTVTMTEYGDLLPGMNVTGVIILDEGRVPDSGGEYFAHVGGRAGRHPEP